LCCSLTRTSTVRHFIWQLKNFEKNGNWVNFMCAGSSYRQPHADHDMIGIYFMLSKWAANTGFQWKSWTWTPKVLHWRDGQTAWFEAHQFKNYVVVNIEQWQLQWCWNCWLCSCTVVSPKNWSIMCVYSSSKCWTNYM